MKTHGRKLSAFLAAVSISLLLAHAAGAQDAGAENELVVDGKRPLVKVELDRASLRIDMESYRQHLRASIEHALAAEPANRSADRVAAAEPRPRG